MKLITKLQIAEKVGIKTAMKIQRIIEDPGFPRPVQVPGVSFDKWLEADVDEWLFGLPKKEKAV